MSNNLPSYYDIMEGRAKGTAKQYELINAWLERRKIDNMILEKQLATWKNQHQKKKRKIIKKAL